jgi:hypothetical protein
MFRPCKWAIIRLFKELVRRLYTRRGEYLGDEISSYIIVRGVNTGYQRFIYVCACEQPDDGPFTRPKHVVVSYKLLLSDVVMLID